MRLPSYDRWLALGSLIASIGASAVLGWLFYVLQSNGKLSFLSWFGVVALIITGIGCLMSIIGFFKPMDEKALSARQLPRIGYDISGSGAVNSRNAHIRNQDTAFRIRDDGRLQDENSDIA